MRRIKLLFLLLPAPLALVWWLVQVRSSPPRQGTSPGSSQTREGTDGKRLESPGWEPVSSPIASVALQTAEGVFIVPDIAEMAGQLNAPEATIEQDLSLLDRLIEFHRRANGGANPEGGENHEIVDQLCGRNEKRLAVLPPGLPAINAAGQLLDRWGTPYHFHSVSRNQLEVRSAGPDGKLWTSDDVQLADEIEFPGHRKAAPLWEH